jgi:SNF2 family DNA or RNA helicase/uncharacterized Zn finger protein
MQYGITWWGQQWLNSLNKIDYSNRLPRGRTYANKGAVLSIEIKYNTIKAKVQGSRPSPYNVTIKVPEFNKEQKTTLINLIKDNPQILSKLLNKEISPELDKLAQNREIKIFPETWMDFDMNCSCPDWAVPCKHISAVLYIIANEIDKNPFLLFNLHGIELLQEFKNDGNDIIRITAIPESNDFLTNTLIDQTSKIDSESLMNIDLSKLEEESSPFNLLSSSPIFYQKDFKNLLQKTVQNVSKYITTYVINNAEDNSEVLESSITDSSVRLIFDKNLIFTSVEIIFNGQRISSKLDDFIKKLQLIKDKHLPFLDYSWLYLYEIYLFCLQLLIKKLYYPQLFKAGENTYLLQYIPAIIDDSVNSVFQNFVNCIPQGIIEIKDKEKNLYINSSAQEVNFLCSVFLNFFFNKAFTENRLSQEWTNSALSSEIRDLFTKGRVKGFNTFETRQIPSSIHQWLSIFEIHTRKYVPLIKIEEHPNGFKLSLLIDNSSDANFSPIELSKIFNNKKYDAIRLEILKDINLVANYMPQLNVLLSNKGAEDVIISLSDFSNILFNVIPVIKLLGIKILLPKSLKELIHPRLALKIKQKNKKESFSLLNLDSLLNYDWQISLGEQLMDTDEFFKLVKNLKGLVKLKDKYLFLDEAELKQLQKNLEKNYELNSIGLIQAILTKEVSGHQVFLSPEIMNAVKELLKIEQIPIPRGLQATLRPYQERGFDWLVRNSKIGLGCIIADDMGLGKTIQVISLLLHYKELGLLKKALVVAPTTLLSNWENELSRFAPSLSYYSYHGNERKDDFEKFDIILTSYGIIRNDAEKFEEYKWQFLIIDEAQNIKNYSTEQTKAIKKIKADIHIAMSGTPVENRLSEYWSIFDFAIKGYLGSYKSFNEEFVKPIHYNHDLTSINRFKNITSPFILRRLKTDKNIISDLPDKVENNYYAELSPLQAALYENIVGETIKKIEGSEGIARKGLVLKLLLELKQISNHPYQYLKHGSKDYKQSGKAALLIDLVESIIESDEKVLIFTQFKEMGKLLSELIFCETQQMPLFLHGGCSRNQRDEMISKFQNGFHQIFILSLKAGGTGLNLTAANHVIHYDLWWNPAVESQATDRAFRIGQKKNVMVYRLISKGTVEEKIDFMLKEKKELADLTVTTGEKWIGNLSNEEIKELVKLS